MKKFDWWEAIRSIEKDDDALTTEDLVEVYHLGTKFQEAVSENKECFLGLTGNPYSIYLNLEKWKREIGISDEILQHGDSIDFFLRANGEFSGLKNPAMVCYANSILQTWFHNPLLLNPILEIDASGPGKLPLLLLQKIFIQLKNTRLKSVDPILLYEALGIDVSEQHDALEFSMRFSEGLGRIEPRLKVLFDGKFNGTQQHRTTCLACGGTLVTREFFNFLTLNPEKTLQQALWEKLAPENIQGHKCSQCLQVADAERRLEITALPEILQFQIMRFTYTNRKITTPLIYPDEIDLGGFVNQGEGEDLTYTAHAALIHYGTTPNTGHYIVKIKTANGWTVINDRLLMKEDPQDGGNNEDENVYMIVYIKKSLLLHLPPEPEKSERFKAFEKEVEEDDAKEIKNMEVFMKTAHKRYQAIAKISQCPKTGKNPLEFYFLSMKWIRSLRTGLDDTEKVVGEIDNQDLKCPHGKVLPPRASRMTMLYRVLPPESADYVYNEFGGGPKLLVKDNICKECVILMRKQYDKKKQKDGQDAPPQLQGLEEPMEVDSDPETQNQSPPNTLAFKVPNEIIILTRLPSGEEKSLTMDTRLTLKELKTQIADSNMKTRPSEKWDVEFLLDGRKVEDESKSFSEFGCKHGSHSVVHARCTLQQCNKKCSSMKLTI